MEKIKITFLGTGAVIPTARRNHPAVLLQYKNENILFDCGEGTQRQFRKAKINPCKITKILISHWHGDHVFGLPGLMNTLVLNGYNRELQIYGPRGSKEKMRQYLDLAGINPNKLKLKVHEVDDEIFYDGGEFYLEAGSLKHSSRVNGYSFVVREKNRLDKDKLSKLRIPNSPLVSELTKGKVVKIDGKKVDGKKLMYKETGRKITILFDTSFCDEAVKMAKNSDVLISEATFSEDEREAANEKLHLTAKDASKIAKKAKAKTLVLMHMSQRYDVIPKKILEEAKKVFDNTRVAEDLDEVVL